MVPECPFESPCIGIEDLVGICVQLRFILYFFAMLFFIPVLEMKTSCLAFWRAVAPLALLPHRNNL